MNNFQPDVALGEDWATLQNGTGRQNSLQQLEKEHKNQPLGTESTVQGAFAFRSD